MTLVPMLNRYIYSFGGQFDRRFDAGNEPAVEQILKYDTLKDTWE